MRRQIASPDQPRGWMIRYALVPRDHTRYFVCPTLVPESSDIPSLHRSATRILVGLWRGLTNQEGRR